MSWVQRETEDVATRKMLAQSRADQEKWLAAIALTLSQLGSGAQTLVQDYLVEVVTAVVGVALGTYASREFVTLVRSEVQRRLSQPKLVRETSRQGYFSGLAASVMAAIPGCKRKDVDGFTDVVLQPQLEKSLRVLAVSSRWGLMQAVVFCRCCLLCRCHHVCTVCVLGDVFTETPSETGHRCVTPCFTARPAPGKRW